jgi:chaperonin GroES
VVKRVEEEQKTESGLYIPDTAKEKPIQGDVVAVGDGKILDNGEKRPMAVKEGDRVIFAKYAGTEIEAGGETVLVMREDDIMGVVQ